MTKAVDSSRFLFVRHLSLGSIACVDAKGYRTAALFAAGKAPNG